MLICEQIRYSRHSTLGAQIVILNTTLVRTSEIAIGIHTLLT